MQLSPRLCLQRSAGNSGNQLCPYNNTYRTHQLIHSGVLLLTTVAAPQNKLAMGLFTAGMTMFSGSIYLLVLDPQRFKALGPVTPLGGLCLIAGWGALAWRGRLPPVRVS